MAALAPYGVTNERLDTVSNYYRYVRSRGELWPTQPAAAYALVRRGVVTGYVVTSGGSGYSSPPIVTVPGMTGAAGRGPAIFQPGLRRQRGGLGHHDHAGQIEVTVALSWSDTEVVARALCRLRPEARPLEVPPDTLRAWVTALPGFHDAGAAADREALRAIQMLWYELTQEDASDVSE